MPPELQSVIAGKLDAVSFHNLKLVCKGINTWTKDPPKLSASEWQQYHSGLESYARRRRKLQTLGCSDCKKLLDKVLFSDTALHKPLNKERLCISCTIKKRIRRNFKVNKEELFGCRGCLKAKPLHEEDSCYVDQARWYEDFPGTGTGKFIATRNFRWCRDCWTPIANYRSLENSP